MTDEQLKRAREFCAAFEEAPWYQRSPLGYFLPAALDALEAARAEIDRLDSERNHYRETCVELRAELMGMARSVGERIAVWRNDAARESLAFLEQLRELYADPAELAKGEP